MEVGEEELKVVEGGKRRTTVQLLQADALESPVIVQV